jgi:DNA replication and repair protein RecF
MLLRSLNITDFKNIEEARLQFSDKLNGFVGDNAMGKSNILDAIYFLSFAKSFSGVNDNMLIRRGTQAAFVRGQYIKGGADEEVAAALGAKRKSLKRSGKEYKRLSEHIGHFPAVLVAPADLNLVTGTSEERRKFLDMVISQADSRYLDCLIKYNRALEQRNRMLRDNITDTNLFLAIDLTLDANARYIYNVRQQQIQRLAEIHARNYHLIAGDDEPVALAYETQLDRVDDRSLMTLLEQNRQRDFVLRHTSVGIHRDDIDMQINGLPVRRVASQGQAKTFTVALRFAQYQFLAEATRLKPLLLLDDIFDKLDANRVEQIINLVASDAFGQIFITDTNRTHLDHILARANAPASLFGVRDGVTTPLSIPDQTSTI